MKSILRTAVSLALVAAFISGVSIYLNKYAVKAVDDSLLFRAARSVRE